MRGLGRLLLWGMGRESLSYLHFPSAFAQGSRYSGSLLVSRLVHIYPNRLAAVAFLSVGYTPPQPGFDYEAAMGTMKEMFGSDLIGYWELFASKDGPGLCAKNVSFPFLDLIFSSASLRCLSYSSTLSTAFSFLATHRYGKPTWLLEAKREHGFKAIGKQAFQSTGATQ